MNEPDKLEKGYSMGGMLAVVKMMKEYLDAME